MRTPGFGLSRLSSTSGVFPIASTMSPYLPPQGRLSRLGSSIASESVVPTSGPAITHLEQVRPGLLAALRAVPAQTMALVDAVRAGVRGEGPDGGLGVAGLHEGAQGVRDERAAH